MSPTAVLFETSRRLHFASFTGKGDRAIVERMLAEFEYVIALALEQRSANVAAACWVSTATAARLAPQSSASRCNLQGSLGIPSPRAIALSCAPLGHCLRGAVERVNGEECG